MKQLTFSLIFIILISLCTIPSIFPGEDIFQSGISIIDIGSPDIFLKVEAVPQTVKSGKTALLVFEIRNKNNFDLTGVEVTAYDQCIFSGKNSHVIDILRANSTLTWSWTWTSSQTEVDKDCTIRFRTTYNALNSIFQDIVVLYESEYQQRELEGTMYNIPIQSSFPISPLQIGLRFSEPQPLIDNWEYYMYLDYLDVGSGFVDVKSITLNFPKNIKADTISCSGYKRDGSKLTLDREIKFINKKGTPTTCTFTTSASQPLSIETMQMRTEYEYKIDSSINIKVKK